MAAKNLLPEEDFSCPVCCSVFENPVLLSCSHSVCKTCLQHFWQIKGFRECPVCRRRSSKSDPPANLALKNLCESFQRSWGTQRASAGREEMCSLHNEDLKLFCLEDQQPVCVVCQSAKMHRHHACCPVEEAVCDFKNKLKIALEPLQKNLKILEEAKQDYDKTAAHIKKQAHHTKKKIKEEFEKLRIFLKDEEEARIAAVEEEEEEKIHMMWKKLEQITGEIKSLSDTIRSIEKEMETRDIPFLQNFRSTMKQVQFTPKDPEMVSGALINVAKHLSNITFRVWESMHEILQYTPVTLDPNTAHPHLHLSEDLTTVEYRDQDLPLPDTPERFDVYTCALGAEGFNSGTHCWDIEVGGSNDWMLGVIRESESRRGVSFWGSVCSLGYEEFADQYWACCPGKTNQYITPKMKVQRVRVQLDWDRGEVIFTDLLASTHLHTITHTFKERVFPFFFKWSGCMKILPVKPVLETSTEILCSSLYSATAAKW